MKVHGGKSLFEVWKLYHAQTAGNISSCGSWAWGVSNMVLPYEYPWWKSSYGYGNAFAWPILTFPFCKVDIGCFHIVKFTSPLPHWELTNGNFILWTAQCALSYPLFGMYREINVKGFWVQFYVLFVLNFN